MTTSADLRAILVLREGPVRLARLAAWLQRLYDDEREIPVLVGGAAVELYTGGAYTTGDLDFVGRVPETVARRLVEAGFERRGRHWLREDGQVFFEFPGRSLEPVSDPVRLRRGGTELLVIAPEALLADRLAAWKFWGSEIDAVNALRLLQVMGPKFDPRLAARLARTLEVDDERLRLARWARRLGGRWPAEKEIERWTKRKRMRRAPA